MSIDEVSERLGALTQGMEDLKEEFRQHKVEEEAWQNAVSKQLDCLIAKENQRKGMMEEARKTARLWGAALGALMVGAIEVFKHWIFGA